MEQPIPEAGSRWLAAQLVARMEHLPVLLMSRWFPETVEATPPNTPWLEKPFTVKELLTRVHSSLGGSTAIHK
jgi:hypothetical protein